MNGDLSRATLRRVVQAASRAPTAENCQPFRFRWQDGALHLLHDADRARKGQDRRHHDSLLALGALLVGFEIAAAVEGLAVQPALALDDPAAPCWGSLRFHPDPSPALADLAPVLARRCTDRRLFRGGRLPEAALRALAAPGGAAGISTLAAPSPALLRFLWRAERLVWSHEPTWQDVMRWLRVTQAEVERSRDGASWRTMGVDLPELPLLGRLRQPGARAPLARLGGGMAASAWLLRQVRSSAGLVLLTVKQPGRAALVDAGRLMMRAWLCLTEADHGVQPHSQPSFFVHEAAVGNLPPDLDPRFSALYAEGLALWRRELGLGPAELPVMMLRAGWSDSLPEGRRTLRLGVEEVLEGG
ncbi:hypothetical protein L6R53_28885 [Myxococcota bacterium]|nr:hypothetical protein [Myxococcota bacterium]